MSNELSPKGGKCPRCGAAIPENAAAGLCPNCLMALNLKTETVLSADMPGGQETVPPEQIAPHFPQLEILECLGRGGMGVVYKARQKTLGRLVALKLLAPERVDDPRFAERFAREARALAALNHQNIVTVHDFGQAGGFYFLLMEFVDGVNLRQLLRARMFTPEEALAIVPPLCDALQFAHERGIVHRDIKPENILLDKAGRVKVADFGIAKMLGTGDSHADEAPLREQATQAMGTPGYIAPEQKADPQRADSRADIYSLGVVFYEMLTGELPGKPIAPPSKKVHIDVRLDQVVLRALEKTPELRWQTAADLRTQVETMAAGTANAGRGPRPTEPALQHSSSNGRANAWPRRIFFLLIAIIVVPAVLFVGAVALYLSLRVTPKAEPSAGPGIVATTPAEAVNASASGRDSGPTGRVAELLASLEERVNVIKQAPDDNRLLESGDIFNQINEYCDQLQGKNQDGGPALADWGTADSRQFRQILELLAGLENDAEGMRSIAQSRDGNDEERAAMVKKVWNEQFLPNYTRLVAMLQTNNQQSAEVGRDAVESSQSLAFGPVIRRTIYDADGIRTSASMIDLDSGKVFSASAFPSQPSDRAFIFEVEAGLTRMRAEGIDLLGDTSGKSFVGFETIVVPAEQPFDRITAEAIAADSRLTRLPEAETAITSAELPGVYLFKTREGGRGVLEVTRFAENLESMEIRYKVLPSRYAFVRNLVLLSAGGENRFFSLKDLKSYPAIPDNVPVVYVEKRPDPGLCVVVENAHNYPAQREQGRLWEIMSAEDISQPAGLAGLPFERKGVYPLREDRSPLVVLVPEHGLLRIEMDQRTEQVIVEYKKVENQASPVAAPIKQQRRQTDTP